MVFLVVDSSTEDLIAFLAATRPRHQPVINPTTNHFLNTP